MKFGEIAKEGEYRTRRKFAWLPKEVFVYSKQSSPSNNDMNKKITIWLEDYEICEKFSGDKWIHVDKHCLIDFLG